MRENLLPTDGVVEYHGVLFPPDEARAWLGRLHACVPWRHDEVRMFGRTVTTARKVAWYGDFEYRYSGTTKASLAWSPELLELKERVEGACGEAFNACLLNLYHNGGEGMGWHSDDEPSIERDSAIASVSFGAGRPFDFRHRATGAKVRVLLENGSLLVMKGVTQRFWVHALPKSKRIEEPRINLTFRRMRSAGRTS